jgi:Pyridine nucleotide-disulphide oxidoreductase
MAMTHLRQTLKPIGNEMVGHRFLKAAIERGLSARWDVVVFGEEPRTAYDRVALTSSSRSKPTSCRCCRPAARVVLRQRTPCWRRALAHGRDGATAHAGPARTGRWCGPGPPHRRARLQGDLPGHRHRAPIGTDLIVFSVGIRPPDASASACGLDVTERGGILVDEACRTSTRRSLLAQGPGS